MKSKRVDRLADVMSPDWSKLRDTSLSPYQPPRITSAPGVLRSLANSIEKIRAERPSLLAIAAQAETSIAPKILKFATGGTANCSGGRSCARLYLALQGMAVPVGDTAIGMDPTRLEWWLQAMGEHVSGRWGGNERGVRRIAAAQPLIWEQAQAFSQALEKVVRE